MPVDNSYNPDLYFAENVFVYKNFCIRKAIFEWGLNEDDAKDLFSKTILGLIEQQENGEKKFDPNQGLLKKWVIQHLEWKKNEEYRKKSKERIILKDQEMYSYDERESEFLKSALKRNKKYKIKKNTIEVISGSDHLISLKTLEKNKINVGDAVFFSGIDELNNTDKIKLLNQYGDDILVHAKNGEFKIIVEVNFSHSILNRKIGGENSFIHVRERQRIITNDKVDVSISNKNSEDRTILFIQFEKCKDELRELVEKGKLKKNAFKALELNLLGTMNKQDNRPMNTKRIAQLLGLPPGTVGRLMRDASKIFEECMDYKLKKIV